MCITRLGSPNDPRPFLMQLHHHAKSPLAPIQQFLYPSGFRESLPVCQIRIGLRAADTN